MQLVKLSPRTGTCLAERYTEKYFACGLSTTIALVDCSGCSWNSSDSDDADPLGAQQRQERRLVLELRAGRIAERIARCRDSPAPASSPCRGRPRRRSPVRRGCACGRIRPSPRPSPPTGRAGRDSPGSGCPRTSRARPPTPSAPPSRPAARSRRARASSTSRKKSAMHSPSSFGWRGKVKRRELASLPSCVEQDQVVALAGAPANSRRRPAASGCPRASHSASMRAHHRAQLLLRPAEEIVQRAALLPEAPLELVEAALVENGTIAFGARLDHARAPERRRRHRHVARQPPAPRLHRADIDRAERARIRLAQRARL